jgi:hypothetical protein
MPSTREFGSLGHLAGRFFGALLPIGPRPADEQWAEGHLLAGEDVLWRRMSGADRRHAVGVARRTVAELGPPSSNNGASRDVVAAALLHDVGKIEAGLGTWARAGVTVAAMATGRERLVDWSGAATALPALEVDGHRGHGRPWRQRVGLYLGHDRVGAGLLTDAGSDPLTVAWTAEHHRPPERWSVDARLGAALKVADDD